MPGKELDLHRYRDPALPDKGLTGASPAVKSLWVDRGGRFIDEQRDGIDTWVPNGARVQITTLVRAYMQVTEILDGDGQDVGRYVRFVMDGEHMGTLFYGPPRTRLGFRLKRQLIKTQYHV